MVQRNPYRPAQNNPNQPVLGRRCGFCCALRLLSGAVAMHGRGGRPLGFALAVAVIGLAMTACPPTSALAQGGSTGGTLGKHDKSVSGGLERSTSRRPVPKKPARRQSETGPPAASSVAGAWRWSQDCASGRSYKGTFDATPRAGGTFTGRMETAGLSSGPISKGKVKGNRISFTVTYSNVVVRSEHWTGTVSGGSMQGSATTQYDGDCSFSASKL